MIKKYRVKDKREGKYHRQGSVSKRVPEVKNIVKSGSSGEVLQEQLGWNLGYPCRRGDSLPGNPF
jgi:hypothetical protein